MGTFTSARRHVLHTFANTQSAMMKKRVAEYMLSSECPDCHGKRLRRESLSITFAGFDIADMSRMAIKRLDAVFRPYADGTFAGRAKMAAEHPETVMVTERIAEDLLARLAVLLDLGLGYLSLRAQHPDTLTRRTAASPSRYSGPLEPLRRRLRPRRALGRPPSGGYRGAAARARQAQGVGQLALRRRARARRHPPRGLDRRRRAGRGTARRRDSLQRPAGGTRAGRGITDQAVSVRRADAAESDPENSGPLASTAGRHPKQPAEPRRGLPSRRLRP